MSHHLLIAGAVIVLATEAFAQVTTPEVEPNETKAEASTNGIVTMVALDKLMGTTTGTVTTAGATSVDTWRVKTGPLAFGIYRHTLAITTAGTLGHTATIRGLNQVAGVVGTTDSTFQSSGATTPVPYSNAWYGFGREEELYYRVTGTTSTTAAYEATLTTTTVAPLVVPGTFAPGVITLRTEGQTNVDTDIHLFDGTLTVIDGASNDEESIGEGGAGTALQSRLTRTLAPGTYYLAIGRYNVATNDGSPPTDDFQSGIVLDFPNAIAGSSSAYSSADFDVQITDSVGPVNVTVASPVGAAFMLMFVQFTVGSPIPPPVSYCFGDGSTTPCPCTNQGSVGNGCASSVNPNGGNLASTGTSSVGVDTLILLGTGMPNSSALYFQGTTQTAAIFGDGLRCAGGTIIRLGTRTNVSGASQYPVAGNPTISVRGACAAGDVRNYQCWYRNAAAFCTVSTFNLTNGLSVTWGA